MFLQINIFLLLISMVFSVEENKENATTAEEANGKTPLSNEEIIKLEEKIENGKKKLNEFLEAAYKKEKELLKIHFDYRILEIKNADREKQLKEAKEELGLPIVETINVETSEENQDNIEKCNHLQRWLDMHKRLEYQLEKLRKEQLEELQSLESEKQEAEKRLENDVIMLKKREHTSNESADEPKIKKIKKLSQVRDKKAKPNAIEKNSPIIQKPNIPIFMQMQMEENGKAKNAIKIEEVLKPNFAHHQMDKDAKGKEKMEIDEIRKIPKIKQEIQEENEKGKNTLEIKEMPGISAIQTEKVEIKIIFPEEYKHEEETLHFNVHFYKPMADNWNVADPRKFEADAVTDHLGVASFHLKSFMRNFRPELGELWAVNVNEVANHVKIIRKLFQFIPNQQIKIYFDNDNLVEINNTNALAGTSNYLNGFTFNLKVRVVWEESAENEQISQLYPESRFFVRLFKPIAKNVDLKPDPSGLQVNLATNKRTDGVDEATFYMNKELEEGELLALRVSLKGKHEYEKITKFFHYSKSMRTLTFPYDSKELVKSPKKKENKPRSSKSSTKKAKGKSPQKSDSPSNTSSEKITTRQEEIHEPFDPYAFLDLHGWNDDNKGESENWEENSSSN